MEVRHRTFHFHVMRWLFSAFAAARATNDFWQRATPTDGAAWRFDEVAALQLGAAASRAQPNVTGYYPAPRRLTQRLNNYMDIEYSTEVVIGEQPLRAVLDTGSFDLVVFSKNCHARSCSNSTNFYEPARSRTLESLSWTRVHTFGSGSVSSRFALDTITVGPFVMLNQSFWEVTDAQMPILEEGTFEAIIGLGDPDQPLTEVQTHLREDRLRLRACADAKNATGKTCSPALREQEAEDQGFFDDIVQNPPFLKRLKVRRFSVCLLQDPGSEGYITWHDHDPFRYPKIFTSIRITGKNDWSTGVTMVRFEDTPDTVLGCGGGRACRGLIDTGTSLISAPSGVVSSMMERLSDLQNDCANLHEMPSLRLTLGDQEIVMPPDSYLGQVFGDVPLELRALFPHLAEKPKGNVVACTMLLMSMDVVSDDGSELWIFGMPFFRQYFTTFDLGSSVELGQSRDRYVHIAPVGEGCSHPTEAKPPVFASRQRPIRRIDLSKLRVPSWMKARATSG